MADETTFRFVYVDETESEPSQPVDRGGAERTRAQRQAPEVDRQRADEQQRSNPANRGDAGNQNERGNNPTKPEREPTWAGRLLSKLDEFTKSVRDVPLLGRAAGRGEDILRPFLRGADALNRATSDRVRRPFPSLPQRPIEPITEAPIIDTTGRAVRSGAGAAGAARAGGALATAAVATLAVAAGAAALSLAVVAKRSKELTESLAGYSGVLAAARARAQVAQIRQDIQTAQQLGPQLAKFAEAQTKMSIATQQLLNELSRILLPAITGGTNAIAGAIEGLSEDTGAIRKAWEAGDWNKLAESIFRWGDGLMRDKEAKDATADVGLLVDLSQYDNLEIDSDKDSRAADIKRFDVTSETFRDIPGEEIQ